MCRRFKSTIVVQNLGAGPLTPGLAFTPLLTGGATSTFTAAAPVAAGGSWAFDPRFINDVATTDPTKLCSVAATNCLGNGEPHARRDVRRFEEVSLGTFALAPNP